MREALLGSLDKGDTLALLAMADLAEEEGELDEAWAWREIMEKGWAPEKGISVVCQWESDRQPRGVPGPQVIPERLFDRAAELSLTPEHVFFAHYSSFSLAFLALMTALVENKRGKG